MWSTRPKELTPFHPQPTKGASHITLSVLYQISYDIDIDWYSQARGGIGAGDRRWNRSQAQPVEHTDRWGHVESVSARSRVI